MGLNNNNVIVTISRHIENPSIVRTVYSGIFREIEQYSAIFSGIEEHQGILRHIKTLLRRMEP